MKWIFKKGDYFQFDGKENKATVTIEQKRIFAGKEGEDVLIIEKKNSAWGFTAHFRILVVDVKNPDAEFKKIEITLGLIKLFEKAKLLEDYVYSLRRITNFASPIKHFSRKYSRLYDAEFKAIVEDKIYLKRTVVGTILNAMHLDHQKSFISFVASEAPEILTGKNDMDKALILLWNYLANAVIIPAQYLRKSAEILKTIISEEELSKIGFAQDVESNYGKRIQMIKAQADLINEYFDKDKGFILNLSGIIRISIQEDNQKFKSLFKNAPLPITLN
jgi:hypothetical protein